MGAGQLVAGGEHQGVLQLRDAHGNDVSEASLALLAERCPELLGLSVCSDVFPSAGGGAEAMARSFGVPFFGRVPLDPEITRACEAGRSYTEGARLRGARSLLQPIVERLLAATEGVEDANGVA